MQEDDDAPDASEDAEEPSSPDSSESEHEAGLSAEIEAEFFQVCHTKHTHTHMHACMRAHTHTGMHKSLHRNTSVVVRLLYGSRLCLASVCMWASADIMILNVCKCVHSTCAGTLYVWACAHSVVHQNIDFHA